MQISSTSTAYGGGEAQRLLNRLLQPQAAPGGQGLPGSAASSDPGDSAASAPTLTGGPGAAQLAASTLASLLSAQQGPPSSADVAQQVIAAADTDGDGSLSQAEVEKALGQGGASVSDAFSQAFGKLDANGDGKLSADELASAIDARKSAGGAHHAHHAHHGGHAPPTSADLAAQLLDAADSNGDGALSAGEIQTALGPAATGQADSLGQAIAKLDSNGDGKLDASELLAAIDAFRNAHNHVSSGANTTADSTQTVTA
jgi:Ca2+-binding EF-hand superfamily protein